MNFFKVLSETGVNDVIVQFAKTENGEITVIISPKNIIRNNPLLQIKPIVITGTPEHVDTTFSDVVVKALTVAQQLHDIMEANKPKEVIKPVVVKPKAKAVEKVVVADLPKEEKDVPIEKLVKAVEEKTGETIVQVTVQKENFETSVTENKLTLITQEENNKNRELAAGPKVIINKINNESILKEFSLTMKTDAEWVANKDKFEELFLNLSEAEADKPYPKKVRIDLDIKCRKHAIIQAAREKMMNPPKPVEVPKEQEHVTYGSAESINDFEKTFKEAVVVPPPPPSLKYTFPKAFDEEDEEYDDADEYDDYHGSDHDLGGTGHGDDSLSDADSGL